MSEENGITYSEFCKLLGDGYFGLRVKVVAGVTEGPLFHVTLLKHEDRDGEAVTTVLYDGPLRPDPPEDPR